jgi:hypothetical protein
MKVLTASALLALLPASISLSTQYKPERALRMEIESSLKMETTSMEIVRDGEPQNGMGGMSSEAHRKEVHVDKVLEVKDGKPTKVQRNFEKVGGKTSRTVGDNSSDSEIESPLDGVTLEIKRAGDKVEVTAEGKAPDAKALEGHLPEIFLDGLLPEGEVKADASWDLDSDQIKRALRLDVSKALYPPPEREPNGGGEGRGGGRRRGGRMGAGPDFMQMAEWKGKAKLVSTDKEVDGKTCALIELKLEAKGDLPEPEFGGGRRERSFEPPTDSSGAAKNGYEISLEGKFVFAIKDRRPVSLDLEGTAKTEMERETKRDDHTMKFHSVVEGTITYKVAVSVEAAKAEK